MDKLLIEGGARLEGEVRVSGAKNAALPILCAALLTPEPLTLTNVPRLNDVRTMQALLSQMGVGVDTTTPGTVVLDANRIDWPLAPYELVKTMRASILALGPLLARAGAARVSLPGGCAIGARPVDLHLAALEQMGAQINTARGYIEARAPKGGLKGARIVFEKITVTGTENLLMAACLAQGETVLQNAAREPEISDLVVLLRKMGARIDGMDTSTLRVEGVASLHGADHAVIPDRIEAATFMVAAAITGGDLTLINCAPEHLAAITQKLRQTGTHVEETGPGRLRVRAGRKLLAADVITEEYPGFATDMQAQYMALATQAEGTSVITETIFENRFLHASEMTRMGAHITIDGRRAVVRGAAKLSGTTVQASDLRASAGLVLAALVASGETTIDRVYHIDRGYERIVEKLRAVGAGIVRVRSSST